MIERVIEGYKTLVAHLRLRKKMTCLRSVRRQGGKYIVFSLSSAAVGVSTVYYMIRPCLLSGYSVLNRVSLYVSIHYQLH